MKRNIKDQLKHISSLQVYYYIFTKVFQLMVAQYLRYINLKSMDMEEKTPPILIYYNMRGQAQPIRSFFCYLQIYFVEVHLERFEQQRKTLPLSVITRLKNLKIDKSLLPILVDDEQMICDAYPIMAYLCYKHQQEHLLGKNIEEKTRLQEIMEIYNAKQPLSMNQLFKFCDFAINHTDDQIQTEMQRQYIYLMSGSNYLAQICHHIQSHYPQRYIFEGISVLDFLFLESSNYMLGTFKSLLENDHQQIQKRSIVPQKYEIKRQLLVCLKTMKDYKERMLNEPFYFQNQQYLESFSIITFFNPERLKGIKKIWKGNPRYIS